MSTATTRGSPAAGFVPATRKRRKLRMAIDGPSGSGKTFTALRLAFTLGSKVAVIDSERGSSEVYEGDAPDGTPFEFSLNPLSSFAPTTYTAAIEEAVGYGFDVLVIDSLSHAWEGTEGALELVSKKGGNQYTAWKDVTPMHRRMVDAILTCPCHVIVTMRSKVEYVLEENEKGKQVPRKVGMQPIQRPGMEYEFDVYGSLDWSHVMQVTKSRCSALDGLIVHKPGPDLARVLLAWLNKGDMPAATTFNRVIVSSEKVTQLVGMLAELGRDLAKEKVALFRRYAVSEWNLLTVDQARDYEVRLQGEVDKKRKAETNGSEVNASAAAASTAEPPAGGGSGQTLQTALASQPQAPITAADLPPDAKCDFIVLQELRGELDLWLDGKGLGRQPEHAQARDKLRAKVLGVWGVTHDWQLATDVAREKITKLRQQTHAIHEAANGAAEKH